DAVEASQKIPKQLEQNLVGSRRFIVTNQKETIEGTFTYSMDGILQQESNLFVTIPKGINRFAVQGAGANYVHGGAMLQEIVIPVITFKNDRSKSSANIVKQVNVKL